MKCIYHQNEEAVVTCGHCGVALCRECEQTALFRTNNGNGQALCKRCSLQAAQEIVDYDEKWLKKRKIKIGIMAGLFVLPCIISEPMMFFLCWMLVGALANVWNDAKPESIKSQIINAEMSVHHPISSGIGAAIGCIIAAPIAFIAHIIGYVRTQSQYKKDLEILEEVKAQVG